MSSNGLRILPEFKLAVADLQVFLLDLRQWLDQIQFGVGRSFSTEHKSNEQELLRPLEAEVSPVLARLFERFEAACGCIDPELHGAHAHYVKRQLHPLVLCSPFMYRSYVKPLGYAGDYEMINMMVNDPFQGDSAYAKLLNCYFLRTPPVVAHRNRVACLLQMLREEACRRHSVHRPFKVLNVGCGPALEVQEFLATSELSNIAEFTLLDFNDETLDHVSTVLESLRARLNRSTTIRCQEKSVVQLLKEAGKGPAQIPSGGYDMIYCAGLFDYLADSVCRRLMSALYAMLASDGMLLATNVFVINPSRQWMEYSVDWKLIYRDRTGMTNVRPAQVPIGACAVESDPSGLNLFVKIRKLSDV
jgi:extracellular factor (EF) 3-hydroxypalmitic acid methyl ester biosynthesis protein